MNTQNTEQLMTEEDRTIGDIPFLDAFALRNDPLFPGPKPYRQPNIPTDYLLTALPVADSGQADE